MDRSFIFNLNIMPNSVKRDFDSRALLLFFKIYYWWIVEKCLEKPNFCLVSTDKYELYVLFEIFLFFFSKSVKSFRNMFKFKRCGFWEGFINVL